MTCTRYSDLHYFSVVVDNQWRLPLHHIRIIRDLDLPENENLAIRLQQLDPDHARPVSVPQTLHATLRPYQEEGLQWLKFLNENKFGGCLADDMGLGKTIQALSLLLSIDDADSAASLIVMPASLIHNWRNEIRRFAPSLRVLEHTGHDRMTTTGFFGSANVILTTYGILRNDLPLLLQYRFHYIILDESQVIKNPAAHISRAVYQMKSEQRLVLTGTPIENSLTDLWSQFEFLNPGMLGTLAQFQKRYALNWTNDQHKEDILRVSDRLKHLQLIATHFTREGISFSMLTGATTNREKVVKQFREDPANQFFLISLKAGGTGLNLPEAGYVMVLDPWWNPAAELQAINRAHRIGQDKKVIAYKFITSGTIEEKMLVLQQRKQSLSDNFLPTGNPLKDLSQEEIAGLFG